eukprot:TRINITY_DN160_c0_g1_i3.p1 TRINITY_DN160_c0_g1~~TRINITY_DN160_c0_g1_i3.p1  ORF type:complete len:1038 (-),score=290.46 TRINITY_DN160_c0_g1_i3:626-3739(-)
MSEFNFDIPTFDFGVPAAAATTTATTTNTAADSTFTFDIPTFDLGAPAAATSNNNNTFSNNAAPSFEFNIDFGAPTNTATTPSSTDASMTFDFALPTTITTEPAPTPTFDIPEITIPTVQQQTAAPITFEMPDIFVANNKSTTEEWSVPISFSVPEATSSTVPPSSSSAVPTFDFAVPTTPQPAVVSVPPPTFSTGGSLPGLPPLNSSLPPLGGLPGLPPLGGAQGSTSALPPITPLPAITPLQGGAAGFGSTGLPTLVSLGSSAGGIGGVGGLPKLAPKATPPTAKAAPKVIVESVFLTEPSSFYIMKNWKTDSLPDPVKATPTYKTSGSGSKLSLSISLPDNASTSLSVTSDISVKDLLLAVADKNGIWRHEIFSLLSPPNKWLNHDKTLSEEGVKDGTKLLFKVKYWKNQYKLTDTAARHQIYHQVKEEIHSGRWPCNASTAIRLAAHQLYLEVGPFAPATHKPGFLKPKINQYLPQPLLQKEDLEYMERRIFSIHSKIAGETKEDVEELYVSIAQGLQTFGATIFSAKSGEGPSMGVAEDGILVPSDSNPKVYNFVLFPMIKGWKETADGFEIQVQRPDATHKFTASKDITENVLHLLSVYHSLLLSIDKGLLPNLATPYQKPHSVPPYVLFTAPRDNLSRGSPVDLDAKITNRLLILRTAYIKSCAHFKVKQLDTVLWQIDRALDEEIALDKLDLSFLGIGPAEISALAATFEAVFSYTPPPAQAAYFSENMAINQFILNDNPITVAGALDLGRIIKVANFKEYHLKRIGLGTKGAEALIKSLSENSTLEKFDVEGNEIKDKGVSFIVKALKTNTKTNTFIFTNNKLSEQCTIILSGMLAANNFIQELCISNNKIGDGGVGALLNGMQRNTGLQRFDLAATKFTSKTATKLLAWVSERPQMRSLIMADNKLEESTGKAVAKFLSGSSGLTMLDISRTKIGAKAVTEICQALGANKSLRQFYLNGNEFDKKGSGAVIIESLKSNDTLQRLGLADCALGKTLLISLAGVLKASSKLRYIDLSGSPEFKEVIQNA